MNRRPSLVLSALVILFLAKGSIAGVFGSAPSPPVVRLLEADEYSVRLQFSLPDLDAQRVRMMAKTPSDLVWPGWSFTGEPGFPELPCTAIMLLVPPEGDVRVDIVSRSDEIIPAFQPLLVQSTPVAGYDDAMEPETTLADPAVQPAVYPPLYPETSLMLESRAWWRGVPVCRLTIFPFQWDSRSNRLVMATDLHLKITFERSLAEKGSSYRPAFHSPLVDPVRRMQENILINHQMLPMEPAGLAGPPARPLGMATRPGKSASSRTVRLETGTAGIHRVSYTQINTLLGGTLGTPRHRYFRLFTGQDEIACAVIANDEYFRPGDQVEFYAEHFRSIYTQTNVYRLEIDAGEPGLRAQLIDGTVTGAGEPVESFWETLRFEEDNTMWANRPGAPTQEYWFWQRLTAPATLTYTILLPAPDPAAEEALIRISSQGRSTPPPHPNHHHRVRLNNVLVLDQYWDGDELDVQQEFFPAGLIVDGINAVQITAPGDTGAPIDIAYHNYLEVDYWRLFRPVEDELVFTVDATGRRLFKLEDFQSPIVRVYDITEPLRVRLVTRSVIDRIPDTNRYIIRFEDDLTSTRTFCAASSLALKSPVSIGKWEDSGLADPDNGADLIIITDPAFRSSLEPLAGLYRQRRLRVRIVDTREIYDQFSYGIVDPLAIKLFLRQAYNTWLPPAPTYVLLVGDANIDFHDNYGTGKQNRVPPYLTFTRDIGLVPDDNWLVSVDGPDAIPEMFVGRLPGATPGQVDAMLEKLLSHQQTWWGVPERVLFVADNNSLDFEERSEALIERLPANFDVSRVYLRDYGSNVNRATEDIIRHLNDGLLLTNYIGHGAVTNWAGEYVFESADVPRLANLDRLTFVNAMNCINGYFSQPFYYSLSEEFVLAPNGGAVGCLSPSGTMYSWEIELFSDALFEELFTNRNTRMGHLATAAKLQAYARGASADLLTVSVLIGDPVARLFNMLPGDLNADGVVDALDLLIGKQVLAGIVQEYRPPCVQPAAADFNQNGRLDTPDLTYLSHLIVSTDR